MSIEKWLLCIFFLFPFIPQLLLQIPCHFDFSVVRGEQEEVLSLIDDGWHNMGTFPQSTMPLFLPLRSSSGSPNVLFIFLPLTANIQVCIKDVLYEESKMKRSILFLSGLILAVLFFSYCRKEEAETKNIGQIYKEEGVPVRVKKVALQEFKNELSFHSVLSGIQESSAYATFSDEVEKIHVKVGDFAKKNSVLLTFPTDNPATRYYQAKVAFENSKTAYERVKNLYDDGGISRQELDNAAAAFQVAKADWEAVQQTVKVRAPISGYVTKVNVRETDNVQRDDELFTISRIDRMKAKVWLSENEITDIKKDQPAYALWKGDEVKGKVVQVDIAMDQEKQAFQAVMEFENPRNILKPGTTVEVKITTYINPGAIVVKRPNILKEEDSFFVYVLSSGKAERREVKMGRIQVLDVEILDGLSPGDELIVEGQMLLEHGAKVKVIK